MTQISKSVTESLEVTVIVTINKFDIATAKEIYLKAGAMTCVKYLRLLLPNSSLKAATDLFQYLSREWNS